MKGTNNSGGHCIIFNMSIHVFIYLLIYLLTHSHTYLLFFKFVLPPYKPTFLENWKEGQQKSVSSRPRSRNFSLSSERYFVNQINMSLNGSHSDETEVKMGSRMSTNNQALESEEMEKCDFVSGVAENDGLIIPSDDEIEKSFRVNQDGSMTVEMKVRLTIKQEEVIHWTTTVSRACNNNSHEVTSVSQPVSSYNSPDHKDNNNNNRKRESNMHSWESQGEDRQTYKPIKLNQEGENAASEALENPKPRFRRLPTPGPRGVRRKETSVDNIKRLSQTEVQESTVGSYSYMEHTAEGELLEGYCVVSHSSSSSTRPVPKPRKKNLREAKHKKTHSSISGMAEVLQLHNNGKQITETIMHIHQSKDVCENYFAKTWADQDDRFEHKKSDSSESGCQSSSNDWDTNLTKPSASSGNARNNELLSLLSGKSALSQTGSSNASAITDYENQARCESADKEVKRSIKNDSENKRALSKTTKFTQKSERSNKGVFLKSNVTDKKQKGSVPDFLKDLKYSDAPDSHSCTESDNYGQKVTKKKKAQSPEKVKARHGNLSRETYQKINLGQTDTLSPHMKEKFDIIPSSHSAPFMILTKQRSVNGSITKSPKDSKELSESISMPVLHPSPCNVHQYVENWLEKIHPESVPYMDELNPYESRARFQIESAFSDISEMRSVGDEDNLMVNCSSVEGSTVEKPVSQIRCEGEPMETQNLRRSLRKYSAEQVIDIRKSKSSEDLVPKLPDAGGGTSPDAQLNPRVKSGFGRQDILEQLCLSVELLSRTCSHSHPSSLKKKQKSSTLSDFSSQLASVFGSPSTVLLSFLTLMTLRDGIANSANEDSGSANDNSGRNPEALQVMQSIQKLASIEDEEELQARLASLHSSTSAQLQKSWRDFQKKNHIKRSPPLSPKRAKQDFGLENLEENVQDKEHIFSIREVMDKLNMCEDLRREIFSLIRGELTNFDRANPPKEHYGHKNETTDTACEYEDAAVKDELRGSLEEEIKYLEERESHYVDISNARLADLSKESVELHLPQSISHNLAVLRNESPINLKLEDVTNQKRVPGYITEIVDDLKTNQERCVDNEASKADLREENHEMIDNVQMIEEKHTEDEVSQVDEFQVSHYSPTNLEDKVEWQERVGCKQSESELLSPVSDIEAKDGRSGSEVTDNTVSKGDDCTEGCGINSMDKDTYCETSKHRDIISLASEPQTVEAQSPNNGTIQTEEQNAIHKDAKSEASELMINNNDDDDDDQKEVESNYDHEEAIYSTSECENPAAEPHRLSTSGQEDEHSDHYMAASCPWRESENEHELQKSEEDILTERQVHNANKDDEEADEDEDSHVEPNSPLQLHQEGEYSDHSVTYKGQEALADLDLKMLEEESVSENLTHPAVEKEAGTDEDNDEWGNALDLDAESHHGFLDDPSVKDFVMKKSYKSEEIHKAQEEDSAGTEEADMDHECHCVHPTVLPQQLLDFLNLLLMSSALIFTYDSNGCLRLEPDPCNNKAMALSKSNVDHQYARKCLPSPNTTDLSDYRPDTSDSGGHLSQVSTDLLTESGEDQAEKLFMPLGNMTQSYEHLDSKKPHAGTNQTASPNVKSINSLSSFADSMVNGTLQDPVHYNSLDSIGNSELAQCLAIHAKTNSEEGILIDKGRWLLKENHLIRKSPPVPMGIYENVDTTSVDTGQENTSEDASYIPYGRKQSPLGVISSSELEDMAKPCTPKCTYFNMTHSSDSDPFLDNQSVTSNKGRGFTRKSKVVSPLGETSKMLGKKNGSLPSFASVEFKLATGKVHPEDGVGSGVVEKSARSASNTPHEEEAVQSFRCGQYCPIL